MSDERFLVTGSSGCIGAWTLKELRGQGTAVVGLDLDPDPRRFRAIAGDKASAELTLVAGDITDVEVLGRTIDEHEITHVIHLAALQVPFCRADPALGAAVNVVGTINVFEAVRDRLDRVRGLSYASSAGKYSQASTKAAAVDEDHLPSPSTLYGVYKQANESSATVYWADHQVPSVGLRPYVVFGPGRDQGVTAAPTLATEAAVRGEKYHIPYGGGLVLHYARDMAQAFILASRSATEGAHAFNLPGTEIEVAGVIDAVSAELPQAAELITFDPDPLPFPPRLAHGGFNHTIGPCPVTPLDQMISETVAHFCATS